MHDSPPAAAPRAGTQLIDSVQRVIIGKEQPVRLVVAALMAGGHVLLDDVPGTGKTMLARTLARSIEASFCRIQFTPDLLPSDLTGVGILNPRTQEFEFRPGPVFHAVVLADELNRATPRTQAALLEAMEERTVSVDGQTRELPRPFFVIATQNPVEQQGVYELPEAQLDRFMICLSLGYVDALEERKLLLAQREHHPIRDVASVASADGVVAEQAAVRTVTVEDNVADYIVRLVQSTRGHRDLVLGASPRASLALMRMGQALAWLAGREFVIPDDIKAVAPAVLTHRLVLKAQARLGGAKPGDIVAEALRTIPVPTERFRG